MATHRDLTAARLWRRLVGGAALLFASLAGSTVVATLAAYEYWLTTGLICYRRTALAIVLAVGTGTGIALIVSAWRRLVRASRYTAASARMLAVPLPPRLQQLVTGLGLDGDVTLFAAPGAHAFVAGLRRPHIYMSTGLVTELDDAELLAVLRHEARHLERRDPWRQQFAEALQAALPRASALARACQAFRLAMELEADAAATREPADRWHLASALVKVLRAVPGGCSGGAAAAAGMTARDAGMSAVASLDGMALWRLARLTGQPLPGGAAARDLGLGALDRPDAAACRRMQAVYLALLAAAAVLWWCPTVMGALPIFF